MSNTDNAINLLVKLGVDTSPSKDNLNSQIEALSKQLEGLKVDIKLDEKAVKALENLGKIDLSKLQEDIERVGAGLGNIGGQAEKSGKEALRSLTDVQKDLDGVFDHVGDGLRESIKRGISDVDELMAAYEGLKPKFTGEYEVVTEESTGRQIQRVKALTVEFENLKGQMERLRFSNHEKIDMGEGNLDQFLWLPEKESRFIDARMKETQEGIEKATTALSKMGREGKLSAEQIDKLGEQLRKVEDPVGLRDYNKTLQGTLQTNKDLAKAAKERYEVEENIRKLTNQIVAAQAKDPKGMGSSSEVSGMLSELEKINPASANAAKSVKNVSDNFEELKAKSTEAGRSSMTVMDSFRVAMEKFPVWMAASTAFFGTVRSIKSALTEIITLDSQQTVLRRVAGDGIDVNEILKESIQLAKELGNEITDVNEGFISFARQGFRGEELIYMAEMATLLGNISELNVEDAASVLTAGLKGFNIEAENAVRIVDALNEVDNNYSITTQILAEAMQRSAGAASTYGITLEKNIGYTTAIGQVTRESGSVIGNSLKSIYSRITSIQPAIDAMADIGIHIKDASGEMRDVSDILDDLGGKWSSLSAEQQQNLGLQIAGRFQLSRFLILMEQYDEALNATNTALNSSGSGYRENAEYLKSFEAQINRLKNSWIETVIALRDGGLGDSMIVGLQAGLEFFSVLTSIIDKFGFLPSLLGAGGAAFLLFNKNARTSALSLSENLRVLLTMPPAYSRLNASLLATQGTILVKTATTRALTAALGALRTALGFVLPIAAFMALGSAISWVTGKVVEHKREQDELNKSFEEYKQKSIDAVSTNKEQVDELISKYRELDEAKESGSWDNEKEEEYLRVQQELGELFPGIIDYVDSKGRTHIMSAEAIDEEVKAARDLYEAEQALKLLNIKDSYKEKIEEIEKYTKKIREAENLINSSIAARTRKGMSIEGVEAENARAASDIKAYEIRIGTAARDLAREFIDSYKIELSVLGEELSPVLQQELEKMSLSIDFTLLDEDEIDRFRTSLANISIELENAFKSGDGKLFANLSEELEELLHSVGLTDDEIAKIIPRFGDVQDKAESLAKANKEGAKVIGEVGEASSEASGEVDGLAQSTEEAKIYMEGLEGTAYELSSALDKISGVSEKHIDDTDDLLWMYESLSLQMSDLTEGTEEYYLAQEDLFNVGDDLLGLYPHLSSEAWELMNTYEELANSTYYAAANSDELKYAEERLIELYPSLAETGISRIALMDAQIAKIAEEVEAEDVLRSALQAGMDGRLTSEQNKTANTAAGTRARIKLYMKEMQALQELIKADRERAAQGSLGANPQIALMSHDINMQRIQGLLSEAQTEFSGSIAKLREIPAVIEGTRSSANRAARDAAKAAKKAADATKKGSKATKDAKDAAEKYNEEIERSIYLADTYKQALERLNLEMAKIKEEKDRAARGSKEYQDATKKEIALLEAEKKLIQENAAHIREQISSGNVSRTGVIKRSSASYSGKYASQINAAAARYGVDPNLIAAVIQAESSFNPNARSSAGAQGLMQLMPATARSLGVKDPFNIEQNIMGGTKYLADQLKAFGGDIKLALAAYNAGPGNVRKYGGVPPSRETQNYIQRVTNALAKTSQVATAAGNIADYYLGSGFRLTSGFGPRNTGIAGASTNHRGIDLAAKAGTSIKSLRGGKVIASYYHNAQGHVIRIQQDDGIVAQYQHMQKKSHLAVGQAVAAGQEIGKVGSTGVSSGPHLHLEILRNGTPIDPAKYLKEQGQAVTSSTQQVAEKARDIDQLKSDLNQASLDILAVNQKIRDAQIELINSVAESWHLGKEHRDGLIQNSENRIRRLTESSEAYRNELEKQRYSLEVKQKYNEEEYRYYQKLIESGTLNASVVQELTQRLHELGLERNALRFDILELNLRRVTSEMKAFNEEISKYVYEIERSQAIGSLLDEGSADYREQLKIQLGLLEQQRDAIMKQRDALQKLILTQNLSVQQMEEYQKQLRDLSLEYLRLLGTIRNTEKSIEQSTEQMASNLADQLISAYKSYLEQKRDTHMRSLDSEMKAEDDRHRKTMDNYRKELDQFRKIIQERISAIDKEESERDYDREMEKLEKERLEILRRINLLSMDNSMEAIAERKKLQEDLSEIDETISERRHKREVDLRKENLNEMLTDKEEQIRKEEELETERHENERDRIDKLREYWSQFYIDQLNDERKFAKIKQDIVAGNFDALSKEFQEYIQEMQDTMPELENSLDGTMQAVGTSIRMNIIETLQEALRLMGEIGGMQAPGAGGGPGGYGSSLSQADMKVLAGKYITDIMANKETGVRSASIREKAHALAAEGRAEGSTVREDMHYDALFATLTDTQRQQLINFINTQTPDLFITPEYQDELRDYGSERQLTSGDLQVILGKLMTDKMARSDVESVNHRRLTILERGQELGLAGRAAGSSIPRSQSFDQIIGSLDKHSLEVVGNYISAHGPGMFITDYLQDYVKKEAQRILSSAARAESGGYTGEFFGEKMAFLHQKELVLNRKETDQFFRYAPILERLYNLLPSIDKVKPPTLLTPLSQGGIPDVIFNIENMHGTQKEADDFANKFMGAMRQRKGTK